MQIHTALDAVNRFVNACPEGFFQELPTESVPQLRLYLCGPVMASMPDVPLEQAALLLRYRTLLQRFAGSF